MNGYKKVPHSGPVKRYCQALELVDDPQLIEEYKHWHSPAHIWPEIPAGIRSVGILDMEIYLIGTKLFMIVETPLDFDWTGAFGRLATLKRQMEWEDFVSKFQVVKPGSASSEKWQLMERIFSLPK
jgi:L-rhamnose mutarotase